MTATLSSAAVAAVGKHKYARAVDLFTSSEQVDRAILAVSKRAAAWAQVALNDKIKLLKDMKCRMIKCSMQLGSANAVVTGFGTADKPSAAFEARSKTYGLMVTATLSFHVDALITMLERRRDDSMPSAADLPQRRTADGRTVLQVSGGKLPASSVFLRDAEGFMYLKPGQEPAQGAELQAAGAGACLVLGAGNQTFLGVYDTLHVMFHGGYTACLKYHDTQAETAPFTEYILEPLTAAGFLKTFHCGLDMTRHALAHEGVARVHITGSNRTHDLIAWGTGEEAERRRAAGELLLKAPMTSELGNVTPAVIVPGAWKAADVRTAAQLVAYNAGDNAGCNCLAPKAVVIAEEWPQAAEFEAALREELAALPPFPAWYPGTKELHARFVEQHPGCELIAPAAAPDPNFAKPPLPWALHSVTVDSAAAAAAVPGLATEFFAPVVTIVRLSAAACGAGAPPGASNAPPSPPSADGSPAPTSPSSAGAANVTDAFLRAVPGFLEEGVWGNLVASVIAPTADADDATAAALQQCVDDLRYGSVVLNSATFFPYLHPQGMWGGFQAPDTSMLKPGSGVGYVGNTLCLDGVEKQVLRWKWGMPVPPQSLPVPRAALKGLTGLLCGGMTGLWQAATP